MIYSLVKNGNSLVSSFKNGGKRRENFYKVYFFFIKSKSTREKIVFDNHLKNSSTKHRN